ncbi:hypothetical protein AVEN_94321-1 [Araneus ventricosus]|uniref:Uncharacterized protein n=1 Tax=Araneus ventricosus TaxID=182803 RepID=A0A4Y2NQL4_ARAVE|nr:hypothetical protein AVEN_94321-1 [Araneus ventricosus]
MTYFLSGHRGGIGPGARSSRQLQGHPGGGTGEHGEQAPEVPEQTVRGIGRGEQPRPHPHPMGGCRGAQGGGRRSGEKHSGILTSWLIERITKFIQLKTIPIFDVTSKSNG